MIKCVDNGRMTCIGKDGNHKNRYDTSEQAIAVAKHRNEVFPKRATKLVAYKCSHCHYYHLTSKPKRKRNA